SKATDLNIPNTRTFASLDGSADDADGLVDGILTVNGSLNITGSGWINGDGPNGLTFTINVSGDINLTGTAKITSNSNNSTGNGGSITINGGGNITAANGTNITANGKSGGIINITVTGLVTINGKVISQGTITGVGVNQPHGGGPVKIVGG